MSFLGEIDCNGRFVPAIMKVKAIPVMGAIFNLPGGLLERASCANLGFCAVVCAEWECVRVSHWFRRWFSGWQGASGIAGKARGLA